jgi:SAM-dependent methyltransferase
MHPMADLPRLYRELADWWPLLSAPEDYASEAEEYRRILVGASDARVRDVLELGSGGGNNASHLKRAFRLTLVDRSPAMLAVSRRLNPECEHVEGDMRTVRLGRTFDAVFVHDAIAYITSAEDLSAVFETALAHCRPGAPALFVPDYVSETFEPGTDWGGHDGVDRGMRYLAWRWDPDRSDATYVTDFAYLFREPGGSIHAEADRHVEGLFPEATWLGLLEGAGFGAMRTLDVHVGEPVGLRAFLARRPGSWGAAPAASPVPCSASCRTSHASTAHFTRIGYFTTPLSATSSPNSSSSGAASPAIMARNPLIMVSASSTDLPVSASVIIEADDCEIEQP